MTTEARSLEQCVADARAILDGATPGPWRAGWAAFQCRKKHEHGGPSCKYELDHWFTGRFTDSDEEHHISAVDGTLVAGNYDYEEGGIVEPKDVPLITLSRNTYSSLLDLVEALDAYVNLIGGRLPRKVERALAAAHESLQENLPR